MMRYLYLSALAVLFSMTANAQDELRWTSWITVYQDNVNQVQVSFRVSECRSVGGEDVLRGYSFYRTRNLRACERCHLRFSFQWEDCDGKLQTSHVTVPLEKEGIDQDLGMWFLGHRVTVPYFDVKFDDYGRAQREAEQKQKVEEQLAAARKLLKSGDLQAGKRAYQQVLIMDPQNVEAREAIKGIERAEANDRRQAEEDRESRIREERWSGEERQRRYAQYMNEARQHESKGEYEMAQAAYQNALSLRPGDADARNGIARTTGLAERSREARDIQRRLERYETQQREADAAKDELISGVSGFMTSDAKAEFFDALGFGLNLGVGLSYVSIPVIENSTSSLVPGLQYSESGTSSPLGGYFNTEIWLARNANFGIGGDGYLNLGFYYPTAGATGTAAAYAFNVKAHGGLKGFKVHCQYGLESRWGSTTRDTDAVIASTISGATPTGITSQGSFDYATSRFGIGGMLDFSDEQEGELFVSYTLLFDRPDFLPLDKAAIKVHKLLLRYYIDITVYYANNYPIAGIPEYSIDPTKNHNQSLVMVMLSKTFTLFKGEY